MPILIETPVFPACAASPSTFRTLIFNWAFFLLSHCLFGLDYCLEPVLGSNVGLECDPDGNRADVNRGVSMQL